MMLFCNSLKKHITTGKGKTLRSYRSESIRVPRVNPRASGAQLADESLTLLFCKSAEQCVDSARAKN